MTLPGHRSNQSLHLPCRWPCVPGTGDYRQGCPRLNAPPRWNATRISSHLAESTTILGLRAVHARLLGLDGPGPCRCSSASNSSGVWRSSAMPPVAAPAVWQELADAGEHLLQTGRLSDDLDAPLDWSGTGAGRPGTKPSSSSRSCDASPRGQPSGYWFTLGADFSQARWHSCVRITAQQPASWPRQCSTLGR